MRIVRNPSASTPSTPAPSATDEIAEKLAEIYPAEIAHKIAQPNMINAIRFLLGIGVPTEQPARTEVAKP